jgi:hypothetical protein
MLARWQGMVVRAVPAGSRLAAPPGPYHKQGQIPSTRIERYRLVREGLPINPNSRQVTLSASGAGQVQIGPEGLGCRWYPTMVGVSTTVGVNDVATATAYTGPLSAATYQGAASQSGGGDTIGLNNVELYPGQYVIVAWSGGTAGSVATAVVYGVMTALDYV